MIFNMKYLKLYGRLLLQWQNGWKNNYSVEIARASSKRQFENLSGTVNKLLRLPWTATVKDLVLHEKSNSEVQWKTFSWKSLLNLLDNTRSILYTVFPL